MSFAEGGLRCLQNLQDPHYFPPFRNRWPRFVRYSPPLYYQIIEGNTPYVNGWTILKDFAERAVLDVPPHTDTAIVNTRGGGDFPLGALGLGAGAHPLVGGGGSCWGGRERGRRSRGWHRLAEEKSVGV